MAFSLFFMHAWFTHIGERSCPLYQSTMATALALTQQNDEASHRCESSYDRSDNRTHLSTSHLNCTGEICEFSCAYSGGEIQQTISHTNCNERSSSQCELSCDRSGYCVGRRFLTNTQTHTAAMRLLSSVHHCVTGQVCGSCKRLVTHNALIRLLTSVNLHVSGQVTGVSK